MASPLPSETDESAAEPEPRDDTGADAGLGVLERLNVQLSALRTQVAEMDHRMSGIEAGTPLQAAPVHIQLAPESVDQIAAALAGLSAAGAQALDDALAAARDDLAGVLTDLVQDEIQRTLDDAGIDVVVTSEAAVTTDRASVDEDAATDDAPDDAPDDAIATPSATALTVPTAELVAAPAHLVPANEAPANEASPVADIAAPEAAVTESRGSDSQDDDFDSPKDTSDSPPLRLAELDDPFLDALIRREPLSA